MSVSPYATTFFELENASTTGADTQLSNSEKVKKKKRKTSKLQIPISFEDPELNNLVKQRYREFMSNVSAERKACKRKRLAEENDKSLSKQEVIF